MVRQALNYNGIPYLRYDPTSGTKPQAVIMYLHGQGEKGNDISDTTSSIIEKNEIPKQMITPGFEQPYIVIAPQLASNQGGWYANTTQPIVELCKTLGLDIYLCGLSLGSMVGPTLISDNPGVFKGLITVCGKMDISDPSKQTILYNELKRIPSIHYYDPADTTISYGYPSIKSMCDKAKANGSDCTLQLINLTSAHHNIWPIAYQVQNFWAWLSSKVSAPVIISDPVISTVYDGTDVVQTTQSGVVIRTKPTSVTP